MNPNEEENSETSDQFINFSIREYVAEIRKKDWRKCWPFGWLGDFSVHVDLVPRSQAPQSRFFSSQNCPRDSDALHDTRKHTKAPNAFDVGIPNGIEARSKTTPAAQKNDDNTSNGPLKEAQCVNEQISAKSESNVADDHNKPQKNLTRKKPRRFLLLSDILRDLAGPSGDFRVRGDMTNADNVNKFGTETEDESDDVTLDMLFKKRKGVVRSSCSSLIKNEKMKKKKKRKTFDVEKPRVDEEKRAKLGSDDSRGKDSDLGSKSGASMKTSIGELDTRIKKKCQKSSAEDPPSPWRHKSNKDVEAQAKVTITEASETANEDSEMEAVKLLARHFVEEKNPSKPALGVPRPQVVQPITRNLETKPTEASHKRIHATNHGRGTSSSSIPQNTNHSSSNSKHTQRFTNVNNLSKNISTACACVQKKIRESSTNKATPSTQFLRPLDTAKLTKENHKFTLSWVQNNGHCEVVERKVARAICSTNKNPADFTIPNAENRFMRKG